MGLRKPSLFPLEAELVEQHRAQGHGDVCTGAHHEKESILILMSKEQGLDSYTFKVKKWVPITEESASGDLIAFRENLFTN